MAPQSRQVASVLLLLLLLLLLRLLLVGWGVILPVKLRRLCSGSRSSRQMSREQIPAY
jgi:hypothetical protein